jgi:hypothetical protein
MSVHPDLILAVVEDVLCSTEDFVQSVTRWEGHEDARDKALADIKEALAAVAVGARK